jgi:hypothetical protein
MKLLLIALSLSVTLASAAEGQSKVAKRQAAPAVVKPLEIPKGAVETEPGTFRHTDAQGKRWIYRPTPFGVARMPDAPAAKSQTKTPEIADYITAFEDGESVRFERPGPFGVYKWTTKKSDLDATERKAWERAQSKATVKQN